MSELFTRLVDAIGFNDRFAIGDTLGQMEPHELLLSVNFMGPDRTREFLAIYNGPSRARIEEAAQTLEMHGQAPSASSSNLGYEAMMLFQDYVMHQPVMLHKDPTGLLPAPNPGAKELTATDYATAAASIGVETAAVRAVSVVESGGRTGFDTLGRPKILFEAHIFYRLTRGRYFVTHPHLSQPSQTQGKWFYSHDQWSRMYQAMMLNPVAAWASASWGVFQVMGFNHSGFTTVEGFAAAMFVSALEHLKSFLAFCKQNNLVGYMQAHNWAAFANGYNGSGYAANQYDTKMANAYAQYAGQ